MNKKLLMFIIPVLAIGLVFGAVLNFFGQVHQNVTVKQAVTLTGDSCTSNSCSSNQVIYSPDMLFSQVYSLKNNDPNMTRKVTPTTEAVVGNNHLSSDEIKTNYVLYNVGANFSNYNSTCDTTIDASELASITGMGNICVNSGTYSGNVVIPNGVNLIAVNSPESTSPTIINGQVLMNSNSELKGFEISGLKLVKSGGSDGGAVQVYNAENVIIDSNVIKDISGDGQGTLSGIKVYATNPSSNILIKNNEIKDLVNTGKGLNAVMVQGTINGVNILSNSFENLISTNTDYSWDYAVGIENTPASSVVAPVKNLVIKNNLFKEFSSVTEPARGFTVDEASSTNTADASQVTLSDNSFIGISNDLTNKDSNHALISTNNYFDSLNYNANGLAKDEIGTINFDYSNADFSLGPSEVMNFFVVNKVNTNDTGEGTITTTLA